MGGGWWVGGGWTKMKLVLFSTQVEVEVELKLELSLAIVATTRALLWVFPSGNLQIQQEILNKALIINNDE